MWLEPCRWRVTVITTSSTSLGRKSHVAIEKAAFTPPGVPRSRRRGDKAVDSRIICCANRERRPDAANNKASPSPGQSRTLGQISVVSLLMPWQLGGCAMLSRLGLYVVRSRTSVVTAGSAAPGIRPTHRMHVECQQASAGTGSTQAPRLWRTIQAFALRSATSVG